MCGIFCFLFWEYLWLFIYTGEEWNWVNGDVLNLQNLKERKLIIDRACIWTPCSSFSWSSYSQGLFKFLWLNCSHQVHLYWYVSGNIHILCRVLNLPQSQFLTTNVNNNHHAGNSAESKGDSDRKTPTQRYHNLLSILFCCDLLLIMQLPYMFLSYSYNYNSYLMPYWKTTAWQNFHKLQLFENWA